MRHLLILTCLLFGTGAVADEADFDFKSKKANIAIEKYQATIKKAKAVEKRNRVDLILTLEAALKYERTEGELDEAIKIRDAIKALKKGASPAGASVAGSKGKKKAKKSKARIPRDAVKYKGHHYKLFDIQGPHGVAMKKAESMGGHLVRIQGPDEQQFVAKLANSGRLSNYWIDGSDELSEGRWLFSDGTRMKFFYWYRGEPNNVGLSEHYIVIQRNEDWRWNDSVLRGDANIRAHHPRGFICEWDE